MQGAVRWGAAYLEKHCDDRIAVNVGRVRVAHVLQYSYSIIDMHIN